MHNMRNRPNLRNARNWLNLHSENRVAAAGREWAVKPSLKKPRAIKQVVSSLSVLGDNESDEDVPMVSVVQNSKGLLESLPQPQAALQSNGTIDGRYKPKYHNPTITKTMLGKTMSLGGAMALLATIQHGHQAVISCPQMNMGTTPGYESGAMHLCSL